MITTGNHVWDQREILPYVDRDKTLLRPINFTPNTPGNGMVRFQTTSGQKITVINAIARLFMKDSDDPFRILDALMKEERLGQNTNAIFIDFHGEATSEKMALAHYLDGRVSAVIGTHTHIPTADALVLPRGTAYMTDAGMTGDYLSVIGVDKDIALHRFIKSVPGERMRPAKEEATLCGALVVTDDDSGLAKSIAPIRMGGVLRQECP